MYVAAYRTVSIQRDLRWVRRNYYKCVKGVEVRTQTRSCYKAPCIAASYKLQMAFRAIRVYALLNEFMRTCVHVTRFHFPGRSL